MRATFAAVAGAALIVFGCADDRGHRSDRSTRDMGYGASGAPAASTGIGRSATTTSLGAADLNFIAQATGGRDPLLRAFAARYEPGLRQHLAWAEDLARQTVSSAR